MIGGYYIAQTYIGDYYPTYGTALSVSITDSVAFSDLLTKSLVLSKSESLNLQDGATPLVVFTRTVSDTVTNSDTIINSVVLNKDETIELSDNVTKETTIAKADSITAIDTLTSEKGILRDFTETVSLSDESTTTIGRFVFPTDAITVYDSTPIKTIYLIKSESILFSDYPWINLTDYPESWTQEGDSGGTWIQEGNSGGVWTVQEQDNSMRGLV